MTAEAVRRIWCRELERDDISADDDFFALGGQSVIMAKIQMAYIDELGVEVPVDQMFRNPTVASIVAYIEAAENAENAENAEKTESAEGKEDVSPDAVNPR
ncbi:acyl carrier protein [Streptomyces sp. NPDC006798]|uniref:acyl carrier protein n=1 Tax=Streptomyces sp. NPDC006798 TaxID=3155462 RepID=UPI0033F9648C